MLTQTQLKLMFFGFIILAVILEVIADVLFKKWSMNNKNFMLIIGLVIYLFGTMFWAFSLKYEFFAKAGAVFSILNLVLITLLGVFMFKENLSLINKLGIALGMISIILIEI